jgi:coenzyme F420-reducing hydrogenase beta subunit
MPCSTDEKRKAATAVSPGDMVRSGLCIGCGVCLAEANSGTRMAWDAYGQLQPQGGSGWFDRPDERFSRICPFSPLASNEDEIAANRFPSAQVASEQVGRFQAAYVGYAAEADFREQGSSGGMVSWVAAELLRQGLVDGVVHVAPAEDAFFRYRISRSVAEIRNGAKSRYYPIELSEVLREIRSVPGRYAVVGIPCFIKAVNLLRAADPVYAERIAFTLGLFCGHMKSARFVESFAWQLGVDIDEITGVEYRLKDPDRPANWYTAQLTEANGTVAKRDWFHLADGDWGAGFFQNSACNFCDDVVAETADISFGDAWVEPYSSDGRGTNVVIVRSQLLCGIVDEAIANGRLALEQVDEAFVARTQAAGLRQRREGLSYRLAWHRRGLRPAKRVGARGAIKGRRKLIYRMRFGISAWSHRMFWLARKLRWPALYTRWAAAALTIYHGLAYSQGRLGRIVDRLSSGTGSD